MNSSGSASAPILAQAAPPQTAPVNPSGMLSKACEEDRKREPEPEFYENFSKSILRRRFNEFWGGKYTERYILTYLEFMHLSGMIDNLEYLEFKNALDKGQL